MYDQGCRVHHPGNCDCFHPCRLLTDHLPPRRELTTTPTMTAAKVPAAAPQPAASHVLPSEGMPMGHPSLFDVSSLPSFQKSESSLEGTCLLPFVSGAGSIPHFAADVPAQCTSGSGHRQCQQGKPEKMLNPARGLRSRQPSCFCSKNKS